MTQLYDSLTKISFSSRANLPPKSYQSTKQTRTESPVINHDKTTTAMTLPSPHQLNKQRVNHMTWQNHHNNNTTTIAKQPTIRKAQTQSTDKTNIMTKKGKPQLLSILMLPSLCCYLDDVILALSSWCYKASTTTNTRQWQDNHRIKDKTPIVHIVHLCKLVCIACKALIKSIWWQQR